MIWSYSPKSSPRLGSIPRSVVDVQDFDGLLNELATVSLQTTTNGRAEVFVVLQQSKGGILNQLLSVHAFLRGDLGELRNLVRTEMYFHAVSVWGSSHSVNCFRHR